MENRLVTQHKIYMLILNDMRSDNIEDTKIAAAGYDPKKIIEWYNEQKNKNGVWKDDRWMKSFKKDSPLEWFNTSNNLEIYTNMPNRGWTGIYAEWINNDVWYAQKSKFFIIE